MFILVLQQCHKENEDKWKRLSRQIADVILPMISKQQVTLDCLEWRLQYVIVIIWNRIYGSFAYILGHQHNSHVFGLNGATMGLE